MSDWVTEVRRLAAERMERVYRLIEESIAADAIKPGDIYRDCAGHPTLCTENDGDAVSGISLFDGTWPRGCSIACCAPEKMTLQEAIDAREKAAYPTKWDKE